MLARLDALESQIARLTSQTEENTNAITQLGTRIGALEVTSTAAAAATPAPPPVTATPTPTPRPTTAALTPPPPPPSKPAGPTAQRLAAVQAIAKPQTDDPGKDEYDYGFRLWDAKFYPEAEQHLQLFLNKYPKHCRATYARNLLGRAYLDEGKPRDAAPWFLENYQADKAGERAPDSLLFLAEAMIAINDTNRACLALAEFSEVYPAIASGRLLAQYKANTARVKCP